MAAVFSKTPKRKSRYFFVASCLALAVVLTGFFSTFILPSLRGTFEAPAVIYIHGAFLFAWTLLLVIQSTLVQRKEVRRHMSLGWVSLAVAAGVIFSTMAAGIYVLRRDVAAGQGQVAISSVVGAFTTPLIFALFVALAVWFRRRPEIHKRLMVLAMIEIIWPAFFRFRHYFPSIPSPEIYFAVLLPDLMLVFAMIWEKVRYGRVHPVYLIGGTLLIAENVAELLLFDTPPWQAFANWLAAFFL